MPLLEHFRPPLSVTHPWKGFHSVRANSITSELNDVLPEGYFAIPEVPLGDQIEIDVEAWPATLAVGEKLPVLPIWIGPDRSLPLALETTYSAACHALRIAAT